MLLSIAWRNIWRHKVRSLIIMLSVLIGLFSGLFVLALYEGMLLSRVRTVIDTEVAHIQIHDPQFKNDYDPAFIIVRGNELLNHLQSDSRIEMASARAVTQGMLSTVTGSAGIQINGVVPKEENQVSLLNKKMIAGEGLNPNRKNGIVIGKKLADKMKLKIGSKLVLTFTDKERNITSGAFRVAGIYQTNNSPLDERMVYVEKNTLTTYLNTPDSFHEIAVLLKNDKDMEAMQQNLQSLYPNYSIKNWKENSPETNMMVSTIDQYSNIIIIIIMLALAFGIINTMLMSVLERTREIGMLSALGMNRIKIFSLVLYETIFLTMIGVPLGFITAFISIYYLSGIGIDISSVSGAAMSGFGFSSIIYPEFPYSSVFSVMMIVTCTALFSALFPSIKAIRLEPADALRQ